MNNKTFEAKRLAHGWVLASNDTVDRDGDIVEPLGLDLSKWEAAGAPILWGHSYTDPFHILGRSVEHRVDRSGFYIKPEWRKPVSDSDPAKVVAQLWEGKIANAFSIGFIPKASVPIPGAGKRFTSAEILEVSLVSVGSNASALRLQMEKAFNSTSYRSDEDKRAVMRFLKSGNRDLTEREIYAQIEDVLLELWLAVVAEQLEDAIRTGAI